MGKKYDFSRAAAATREQVMEQTWADKPVPVQSPADDPDATRRNRNTFMTARLIFLIVIAGALAMFFATRTTGDLQDEVQSTEAVAPVIELIRDQVIGGQEPAEPAEFDIQVEVDHASGKNRLLLLVTERHGYYADTLKIEVWNRNASEDGRLSGSDPLEHFVNKYVSANETLVDCIEIVPAELVHIGGTIGDSDDWDAEVVYYGRARIENPNPLPVVVGATACN